MQRSKASIIWVSILLSLVNILVLLSACQPTPATTTTSTPAASKESIKVGGTWPLTASYGREQQFGVELAFQEANDAGGINGRKIENIYYNDENNNEKVTANTLRSCTVDNVALLVAAPTGGAATAVLAVAKKYNVTLLSPTASADALATEPLFFRANPSATGTVDSGLYTAGRLGYKNVACLLVSDAWGSTAIEIAKRDAPQYGVTILGSEYCSTGATDVSAQLLKLKELKPQAIISFVREKETIAALTGLKSMGWDIPWFDASAIVQGLLTATDPRLLEGVYTDGYADFSKPLNQHLFDAYQKKNNQRMETPHLVAGYDAGRIAVEAFKLASKPDDRTAINEAIRKVRIPLALGGEGLTCDFSKANSATGAKDMTWYQIKSGKSIVVK